MQPLGFDGLARLAERSRRFAAFDPFLNTARVAGLARWGPNLSALVHASALRWPTKTAIIDDAGTVSYRQLDRWATGLANFLRSNGRGPVGVLCRNHRGFPLAQLALERAGRDIVMLSTALPAAQLRSIVDREALDLLIADEEFTDRINEAGITARVLSADPSRLKTWSQSGISLPPRRRSRVVMLTSGTTGPPKGARQAQQTPSAAAVALLDAMPIQMNDVTLVTSPLFHAWGLSHMALALSTGSTLLLQSKFDAGEAIDVLVRCQATVVAVVPITLRRLIEAAPPGLDLPHVRAVCSSGNVLSATLAKTWIDRFGPSLYNFYGSTETAIASVATPTDLVEAPGTVGVPPRGVTVTILGDDDVPVSTGTLGRVFTANAMQFDGYTDGTNRTRLGKLMATGDLGYFDDDGRLFVDGRENDLIVTGGENVFPSLVEEVLERHPSVRQAAVIGMADDEYGQRVVGFVVAESDLDRDELNEWCRHQLASFQQPREIRCVDALPMTTTGKIIRHALASLDFLEPVSPPQRLDHQ